MSMLFHKQLNHFESWNNSEGTQYVLQFYIDSGYEVLFRIISLNFFNLIIRQLLDSFTTHTRRYVASRLMMLGLCIKTHMLLSSTHLPPHGINIYSIKFRKEQ
jgi:hypothetical protein